MLPFFIDAHVHLNHPSIALQNLAKKHNAFFVSINTDIPFFPTIKKQEELSKTYNQDYNISAFITSFPAEGIGSDSWTKDTLNYIRNGLVNGAKGVKIWKNFGMDPKIKDVKGNFITVDHPLLKPILDFLEDNHILLLGHQGEPRNCWLPLPEMTVDSDREYFRNHPEYHMFRQKNYLSYENQIEARDNMLKQHPNLKYVGLHLFSLEWDLEEVASRLDAFPNTMTDLAERICHVQFQAMHDYDKVREFFLKYQDRIIYGTDFICDSQLTEEEISTGLTTLWESHYQFFATENYMSAPEFGGRFRGLKLPEEVLHKIYFKNAINTYQLQELVDKRLNKIL